MPVLIVLACKTLLVVLAVGDRTFLRSLQLVSKHVSLEILEDAAAFWERASALLLVVIIEVDTSR